MLRGWVIFSFTDHCYLIQSFAAIKCFKKKKEIDDTKDSKKKEKVER
jgi:hypothetical protein